MNKKLFKTNNGPHFGNLIRELMEGKKGGVQLAAKKLDYALESLYPIFRKKDVNTSLLKKICEIYKIDLGYFLQGGVGNSDESWEAMDLDNLKLQQRVEVLEAEKSGLEQQNKLLREMLEMYKTGQIAGQINQF
jgi:hypothetical protein